MDTKETIKFIQQVKFSFGFSFWILFVICNFIIWGIGVLWLEYSKFSLLENILFIVYYLFSLFFFFISTKGVLKSKNKYETKNKKISILSTIFIIYWCIQAVSMFLIFLTYFQTKLNVFCNYFCSSSSYKFSNFEQTTGRQLFT